MIVGQKLIQINVTIKYKLFQVDLEIGFLLGWCLLPKKTNKQFIKLFVQIFNFICILIYYLLIFKQLLQFSRIRSKFFTSILENVIIYLTSQICIFSANTRGHKFKHNSEGLLFPFVWNVFRNVLFYQDVLRSQ